MFNLSGVSKMKKDGRLALIPGFIIIILGFLIIPNIAGIYSGSNVCGHANMNIVGFSIIFIGICIVVKENK